MTKTSIEELWIVGHEIFDNEDRPCVVHLVVLMTGWDEGSARAQKQARERWDEVQSRWQRELAEMTLCDIHLEMRQVSDKLGMEDLLMNGGRLFTAI